MAYSQLGYQLQYVASSPPSPAYAAGAERPGLAVAAAARAVAGDAGAGGAGGATAGAAAASLLGVYAGPYGGQAYCGYLPYPGTTELGLFAHLVRALAAQKSAGKLCNFGDAQALGVPCFSVSRAWLKPPEPDDVRSST